MRKIAVVILALHSLSAYAQIVGIDYLQLERDMIWQAVRTPGPTKILATLDFPNDREPYKTSNGVFIAHDHQANDLGMGKEFGYRVYIDIERSHDSIYVYTRYHDDPQAALQRDPPDPPNGKRLSYIFDTTGLILYQRSALRYRTFAFDHKYVYTEKGVKVREFTAIDFPQQHGFGFNNYEPVPRISKKITYTYDLVGDLQQTVEYQGDSTYMYTHQYFYNKSKRLMYVDYYRTKENQFDSRTFYYYNKNDSIIEKREVRSRDTVGVQPINIYRYHYSSLPGMLIKRTEYFTNARDSKVTDSTPYSFEIDTNFLGARGNKTGSVHWIHKFIEARYNTDNKLIQYRLIENNYPDYPTWKAFHRPEEEWLRNNETYTYTDNGLLKTIQ